MREREREVGESKRWKEEQKSEREVGGQQRRRG